MEKILNSSSRKYRRIKRIPGAALVRSRKYESIPDGWVKEQMDFPEMANSLGYRFDARSLFTMRSPKGLIRGGHVEERARFSAILKGAVFMVLVDLRSGDNQGKSETFYLGDSKNAWGDAVILPEGVVAAYTAITEDCLSVWVGNRSYNKFDSLLTLDLFDPQLDIVWPEGTMPQSTEEETEILSLEKLIKKYD